MSTLSPESDLLKQGSQLQSISDSVMPSRFFNQFGTLPVSNAVKVNKLRAMLTDLVSVSITRGDDTKYRIAHCRMRQAISKCEGNASPDQTFFMISDGNTAPVSTKLIPCAPPTATVNNVRTTKAALRKTIIP